MARFQRYERSSTAIRAACEQRGLTGEDFVSLLSAPDEVMAAIAFTFSSGASLPPRAEMRTLLVQTQRLFDLPDPVSEDLPSIGELLFGAARAAFAAAAFIVSGWIVIGSILNGENELSHSTSPLIAISTLVAALFALALLEAAHIGAVALSTADVSLLETSHPRVFHLHRYINTKVKLEHYLAARQVGVVLVVFLVSELTRTVGLAALPGTSIPIPSWADVFLRIGVPGALIVLIIGQVMPQILTARRPAAMMNHLPMSAAFHFTRMIGMLGLAQPASWLVSWAKKTERIPTAPRERYEATVHDVDGHGVEAITRTLLVTPNITTSTTATTVRFVNSERPGIQMKTASSVLAPVKLRSRAYRLKQNESMLITSFTDQKLAGMTGFVYAATVAPPLGEFRDGDVLRVDTAMELPGSAVDDFLLIEKPTKLAIFRIVLEVPPIPLPYVDLESVSSSGVLTTLVERIPVTGRADGSVEIVAKAYYPEQGSILRLSWMQHRTLETEHIALQAVSA